uniref:Zinc knuckle CX2CX4HX4C domain-containing protein n=1 Tax=Manihot esculenta TaxID=3983 RepID=A0A2C9UVI7_MANES
MESSFETLAIDVDENEMLFLTDRQLNLLAMRNTQSNVWRPMRGIHGGGNISYTRIQVAVDVRLPLKHSKKVHVGNDTEFVVLFKYDRLSMFCFLCGKLGHSNKFCELLFGVMGIDVEMGVVNGNHMQHEDSLMVLDAEHKRQRMEITILSNTVQPRLGELETLDIKVVFEDLQLASLLNQTY